MDETILSGGYDNTVRIWDCRSRSFDPIMSLRAFADSVTTVLVTGRVTPGELRGLLGGTSWEGTIVVVCEGPLPAAAGARVAIMDATRDGAFARSWADVRRARRPGSVRDAS